MADTWIMNYIGKVLTTPSKLLKLIIPITRHDHDEDRRGAYVRNISPEFRILFFLFYSIQRRKNKRQGTSVLQLIN